jgi:hypothetical protein
MPKEPRRVPTVLGRVHQRIAPRPSGPVFFCALLERIVERAQGLKPEFIGECLRHD